MEKNKIAMESGHFYRRDGTPCHEVPYADPSKGMRPTTLRDLRKLDLVPSVTQILKEAATPQLTAWKVKQAMLSALTLPRLENEPDEAFCNRIIQDSKEEARKAAERGTELHGAIEKAIIARSIPMNSPWTKHITAIHLELSKRSIDIFDGDGDAEKSFAHISGYGGKIDFSKKDSVILDFKNKPRIEDDKQYGYDEQCAQLAAYRHGLDFDQHSTRLLNVFVGCEDARIVIVEWSTEEAARALQMFLCLLKYWKAKNRL